MGRRSVFKNATLVYWIATITATLAALGATAVGAEPPSLSYLQQDRCSMMSDKLIQATEKAHDLCGKIGKSKKDKKKDSKSTNPASDGTGYETSFTDCQKQAKACEEARDTLEELWDQKEDSGSSTPFLSGSGSQVNADLTSEMRDAVKDCRYAGKAFYSEEFAGEADDVKDRLERAEEKLERKQEQLEQAKQALDSAIEREKETITKAQQAEEEAMAAMRESVLDLSVKLKENADKFIAARAETLTSINALVAQLDSADEEYYATLRQIDASCHAIAQTAASKYQAEIVKAMEEGTYFKGGGMNRQTGNTGYGSGLSGRIEAWGQREYNKCLNSGPNAEAKKQRELARQTRRADLQRQVKQLNDNLNQMELSKNLKDNQDRDQAMEIQTRAKETLTKSQQQMAAATLKLGQLQAGQQPVMPAQGNLAGAGPEAQLLGQMAGMTVAAGTPREVQAVQAAAKAANQAESEYKQLSAENTMLLMQKGVLRGSSNKARDNKETVNFGQVIGAVKAYEYAKQAYDTNCPAAAPAAAPAPAPAAAAAAAAKQ